MNLTQQTILKTCKAKRLVMVRHDSTTRWVKARYSLYLDQVEIIRSNWLIVRVTWLIIHTTPRTPPS